jgi:hypothetical protein
MRNKTKALLMRLPAEILFIIAPVIGSFVIKLTGVPIQGREVSWFAPIFITFIAALYFYARYLENKDDSFF